MLSFLAVVQCGVPNEINNGYIQSVEGTSYGKTAVYECNDGFGKSHNNPVRCNKDGVWENRPSCTCKFMYLLEIS